MALDLYSLALPYSYIDAVKLALEVMVAVDIAIIYRLPVKGRELMRYTTTPGQELARSGTAYVSFVFAVLILMVIEWGRVHPSSLVIDACLIVMFSWFFLSPRTVVLTDAGVVMNGRTHRWKAFSSYRVNTVTRMIKLRRRGMPFLDPMSLIIPEKGDIESVIRAYVPEDRGVFAKKRPDTARRKLDDRSGPSGGV